MPQANLSRGTATQRFTRATQMRQTEILTRNSFNFIKKLGDGAYGTVYLTEKKDTRQKYAIKELEKQHIMRFGKINAVFRERDILESVCEC